MQTAEFHINHLTGKGWKWWSGTITVDETIGTKAGRDEYATLRGTVKKMMRKTLMHPGTKAMIKIDGKIIDIWIETYDGGQRFAHEVR